MKAKELLLILVSASMASQSAFACDLIGHGIEKKMGQYRSYRDRNLEQQRRLAEDAANCEARGKKTGEQIAQLASSFSCVAQGDASRLDGEIARIGADCTQIFDKLHQKQQELRTAFQDAKSDLDQGMANFESASLARSACPEEFSTMQTMVQAFKALEGRILGVEKDADDHHRDYGRFTDASNSLKAVTGALNANCTSEPGSQPILAGRHETGSGSGVGSNANDHASYIGGRNPAGGASDITGSNEAGAQAQESQKIVEHQ